MKQLRKPKVLIIGSNSLNIGDLSIPLSMLETLKETMPKAEFTVLAAVPQVTSKYTSIKVLPHLFSWRSTNLRKQIMSLMLLPANILWLKSHYLRSPLNLILDNTSKQILQEYANADIILSCGGGYLQNKVGGLGVLKSLYEIYLATLLKKPVMIYAQSISLLQGKIARTITRWVLNRVNLITLREEKSLGFVQGLNIRQTPIFVTADAALLFASAPQARAKKILTNEEIGNPVPLVIITTTANMPWTVNYIEKIAKYQSMLASLITYITKKTKAQILFIPMDIKSDNQEASLVSKVRKLIGKAFGGGFSYTEEKELLSGIIAQIENKSRVKILQGNYSPQEIKAIITLCEVHIATRMHSIIFASTAGVPSLAIPYEPKIASFMEMLGQDEYIIDINNLDLEEAISKFNKLWANRDKAREVILAKIEVLKEKSYQNAQLATELCFSKATLVNK